MNKLELSKDEIENIKNACKNYKIHTMSHLSPEANNEEREEIESCQHRETNSK